MATVVLLAFVVPDVATWFGETVPQYLGQHLGLSILFTSLLGQWGPGGAVSNTTATIKDWTGDGDGLNNG